ncbi:hypothetical protein C9374_005512 [Naegleria lovaniensis]|uniref:Uncharacterized protein n=1 Tax=Naegleria lovaniensis TaxID=51637 RepID=A0AA88KK60_NAELO|nr:uncharacterized protein C9374_005512 [Naegleria lovaniensis]KAG2382310.1 hypothetical protein C9374_005512 [Naegleria lovaniensis]
MAPKRKQAPEKSTTSSNTKKVKNQMNDDEEKQTSKDLSWFEKLNHDEFYSMVQFMDASSFRTLPLISKHVQGMFADCLNRMVDYGEFEELMRAKRVDPRISMYLLQLDDHGEALNNSNFVKTYKKGRQSLSFEIFFKALNRYPGGNSDQFILKWNLVFEANKKPSLKKGSLYNWDGEIGGHKMGALKTIRGFNDFLKSVMALSFEQPNQKGKYYCTVTDERRDSEEYDTKWSQIQVKAHSGNDLILDFMQQAIYPNDRARSTARKEEEVTPSTAMAKMLQELAAFCGVTTPEQESEKKTISQENGGRALKLGSGYTPLQSFLSKLE